MLPRTPAELEEWGRRLNKCLGDFGPAAASGYSVLIGVRRFDVLTSCAELRGGVLQQFLGPRNRRVAATDAGEVVGELLSKGLLNRNEHRNRAWLELANPPSESVTQTQLTP